MTATEEVDRCNRIRIRIWTRVETRSERVTVSYTSAIPAGDMRKDFE